jgi:predicted phosphohydrolase
MTIEFQIVSDLHIEYKNNDVPNPLDYITPSADILILAGDIGSLYKINQLKSFLQLLCPLFKATIYIPGNHEYYLQDSFEPIPFELLTKRLYDLENIPSLYILNQSSIIINDICITGCTLWTKPLINLPKFIVKIHDINTYAYHVLHNNDLEYIENMIQFCKNKNLKLLVVTHHCPTEEVLQNFKKDKYRSLYVSDLDYLLNKENVHTWVCGHLHYNFDFNTKNGTRVVGNQKGKPKDQINDFLKNFIVRV